ncbi:MAG: tetratricopeptide repeat protein [Sandaracinaceae bacterium]|nr:MAG: tetratricopeptide repeat protein [Sandaracinaceae bacterium]
MTRRAPATWGDLLEDLRRARLDDDFERAEDILEHMRREAAHQGDLSLEASTLFYEGVVADESGDLERAERCFMHLVELDRRLHGPTHEAVADALNSLGVVRTARGDPEGAAEAYLACAEIHVDLRTAQRVPSLVSVGDAFHRAGATEEAQGAYARALEHPAPDDAPWHEHASLRIQRYLVEAKRFPEALRVVAVALNRPLGSSQRFREARAQLLIALGHLSWVFGQDSQCHAAHRAALSFTEDAALRDEAERAMAAVPEEAALDGPLDAYRVVFTLDDGLAHVLHAGRGFFMTRDVEAPILGEILERDETTKRFRRPD